MTFRVSFLPIAAMFTIAGCMSLSSPARPSDGVWRLSGTIGSITGGPIAGARLTVQDGANKDAQVTSDASGRYVFASLESGRFTMVIDASGFVSVSPVVDLYHDLEVNFALRLAADSR
jgi:hypothetical protein